MKAEVARANFSEVADKARTELSKATIRPGRNFSKSATTRVSNRDCIYAENFSARVHT